MDMCSVPRHPSNYEDLPVGKRKYSVRKNIQSPESPSEYRYPKPSQEERIRLQPVINAMSKPPLMEELAPRYSPVHSLEVTQKPVLEPQLELLSKTLYDREVKAAMRKETTESLDNQLAEKELARLQAKAAKDEEYAMLLQKLKLQQEHEFKLRAEHLLRTREYHGELDRQSRMKEYRPRRMLPQKNTGTPSWTPPPARFTKKAPKSVTYNPITGELKNAAVQPNLVSGFANRSQDYPRPLKTYLIPTKYN